MSREQERIRKKLKQNPIVECNWIQRKFYPTLFSKFSRVKDPRNQSYIDYSVKTMLGTLYYKCIGGISSMQEMNRRFNDDKVVENLYFFWRYKGIIFPMVLPKMNFWKDWIRKNWKKYRKISHIPWYGGKPLTMPEYWKMADYHRCHGTGRRVSEKEWLLSEQML